MKSARVLRGKALRSPLPSGRASFFFLNLFWKKRVLRLSERPSGSCTSGGVLRLPPEGRASFGFLPKEGRPSLPSGSFTSGGVAAFCKKLNLVRRLSERSFTSGGFPKEAPEVPEGSNLFLNVLREASPLAAFRRKRTSFGKLHLWRLPSESFTSGASFGKTRVAPLDLRLRDPLECRLTICFPKAS